LHISRNPEDKVNISWSSQVKIVPTAVLQKSDFCESHSVPIKKKGNSMTDI
jgi:hypothetical protein